MSTFSLDIQRFVEKAKENANQVVGDVVKSVAHKIDERSPVGNPKLWKSPPPPGYVGGRFRANWQLGIGVAPPGTIDAVDPSGEKTQSRIVASIPSDAAGKVYWISNNLPYAMALEMGHSHAQAPQGIVGRTAIEFQQIVRAAAEKLP